jgi:hypothetical protein
VSTPTYIHVLSYAMTSGARTPREAHNRAYTADAARFPDRILAATPDGFQVLLNRQTGQEGTLPYADARVAWPHYSSAVKARMRQLHGVH